MIVHYIILCNLVDSFIPQSSERSVAVTQSLEMRNVYVVSQCTQLRITDHFVLYTQVSVQRVEGLFQKHVRLFR